MDDVDKQASFGAFPSARPSTRR